MQIAHDDETLTESYEGCYLQTEQEIHEILDKQIGKENVDIGLQNTNIIADMIEIVNMPFQEPQLPTFPLPEGFADNHDYLIKLANDGWLKRKYDNLSDDEINIRKERLEYELDVIKQMNYSGYFLIVWDFINWAKENGVFVGAGIVTGKQIGRAHV